MTNKPQIERSAKFLPCPICNSEGFTNAIESCDHTLKERMEASTPTVSDAEALQETNMAVFMVGGRAYTLRGEGAEIVWDHMQQLKDAKLQGALAMQKAAMMKCTQTYQNAPNNPPLYMRDAIGIGCIAARDAIYTIKAEQVI